MEFITSCSKFSFFGVGNLKIRISESALQFFWANYKSKVITQKQSTTVPEVIAANREALVKYLKGIKVSSL